MWLAVHGSGRASPGRGERGLNALLPWQVTLSRRLRLLALPSLPVPRHTPAAVMLMTCAEEDSGSDKALGRSS